MCVCVYVCACGGGGSEGVLVSYMFGYNGKAKQIYYNISKNF